MALVPIIGQNSNGDFRSRRMKHVFRLDPLATRPPELSSQDVQRFHIGFGCWQLLTLLGCLTSENPSTCPTCMRKKHGTQMVSLDLELALQNPERQWKHIKKSYKNKNHINLCVYYVYLCIWVNINYMTILLSHQVTQPPHCGFPWSRSLWLGLRQLFLRIGPEGAQECQWLLRFAAGKQESCRMHFMSRYDEKPGIINAQNAGYALWFISEFVFVLIFIACEHSTSYVSYFH